MAATSDGAAGAEVVHQRDGARGGGGIRVVRVRGDHHVGAFEVLGGGLGDGSPVVGADGESVVQEPFAATEVVLQTGEVHSGGYGVDP
ncbi:hypothetical protein ACIOJE_18265 [Kitasatospora sp. NPDC087861]|uniref:hypothetical protein n=1 Tax=unclassified Kitasatospora TaxID=2633591 RepID=UPI002476DF62|nr:hypothetical protein [Kitasatospora sp. MAA19]